MRRYFADRPQGRAALVGTFFAAILVAALLLGATPPEASAQAAPSPILAPGWEPLAFEAPEPGSYALPPLGRAADGELLDTEGRPVRLRDVLADRIAVLAFVYRSCNDVNGCPLTNFVLSNLRDRIAEDSSLAERVRLVSVSIDPVRDTPAAMGRLAGVLATPQVQWRFLTSDSESALQPVLDAWGQSVVRDVDEEGRSLGSLSHILRVFVVDAAARIRNVYSASYLHADTLLSDLRTLHAEEAQGSPTESHPQQREAPNGDDDVSILTENLRSPPRGLPPLPGVEATPARIALGRRLFFDRRLSHNDTISCAMCHVPEQGFTSNEVATAVGIEGRTVRRNTPTLLNVAYEQRLFHDARESRLEQQVWGPLLAANEMGNPSVGAVLATIAALPDYDGRFEAAFDGKGPTMETVGAALAAYQRTLLAADSPFDRRDLTGASNSFSAAAARGLALFSGKARCALCHPTEGSSPMFSDGDVHNTGIGYRRAHARPLAGRRAYTIAPGVQVEIDLSAVVESAEERPEDLGVFEVSRRPADVWKYKTPSLRNVALTAPYMHDGSIATLGDVVTFYDGGGVAHEGLDPALRPLDLSDDEAADLVAFLESLTGDVSRLVADAERAPVGDRRTVAKTPAY